MICVIILISIFFNQCFKCCKTHENFNENDEKNVEKENEEKNHEKSYKKIDVQTKSENITIINAINENFDMHRCLLLTIVIKIDEREKNENFTANNTAKKK